MSRLNRGENIWRIHDHIIDTDGVRWLFFRNACKENDYRVCSDVFAGVLIDD